MQNPNGGYGTWELARTYPWMEVCFQFLFYYLVKSMHYNNIVDIWGNF